jgi:hypothetical protein
MRSIKRSKVIDKLIKETPLEVRLKVDNEMAFITLLSELGLRDDKMWTKDEDEMLSKLIDFAKKHTQYQLETIKKWEDDGKPE